MFNKFFISPLAALFAFILGATSQIVFADFTENQNTGSFKVDLQNVVGTETDPNLTNNCLPPSSGIVQLSDQTQVGHISTVGIRPISFSAWSKIKINFQQQAANEVQVKPVNCDALGTDIVGFESFQTPVLGELSLSGLSTSVDCIRVKVKIDDASDDAPTPLIQGIEVNWIPKPVFLLNLTGNTSKLAGEEISYSLSYSVSYVNANDVVAFIKIPDIASGITNFDADNGQDLNPVFKKANQGGIYTASAITVNGINIPANSVYWDLGDLTSGQAGTLRFSIRSLNGIENGVTYQLQGSIDSLAGDLVVTDSDLALPGDQAFSTIINSTPKPKLEKLASPIVTLGGKNLAVDATGYGSNITYTIRVENVKSQLGDETIFDAQIADNLSDVFSKLTSVCGLGAAAIKNAIIVNGLTLDQLPAHGPNPSSLNSWDDTNRILYWNPYSLDNTGGLNDLQPGQVSYVSFSVNYEAVAGCFDDLLANEVLVNNSAVLTATNLTPITANHPLYFEEVSIVPSGVFAKGDKVNNISEINAGIDDNKTVFQPYQDIFSYQLRILNSGAVRLDSIVLGDMIPLGTSFLSASLPSVYEGQIFYNEVDPRGVSGTLPDFDSATGALGANWSTTFSSASAVNWIIIQVPCLNSQFFPSTDSINGCHNASLNTFVPPALTADIRVRVLTPGDPLNTHPEAVNVCASYDVNNTGLFYAYEAGADISNSSTVLLSSPLVATDLEKSHIQPRIGSFENIANSESKFVTTIPFVQAGEDSGLYKLKVQNTGVDTVLNTQVKIIAPELSINGNPNAKLGFLSDLIITDASGVAATATVDYSSLPDFLVVNLGSLPAGVVRNIEFGFEVPIGAVNQTVYSVKTILSGQDDQSCQSISKEISTTTIIESIPLLQIRKQRNESLIDTAENIHYQLVFANIGESPTTKTVVVDKMPAKTIFEEAYTSPAIDPNGNTFDCTNCDVYFACKNTTGIPAEITPFDPIDYDLIISKFIPGVEIVGGGNTSPQPGSGIWISPSSACAASDVTYVAVVVDDKSITPAQFNVGETGSIGFRVKNDDDGTGPETSGSNVGTVIRNSAAIFCDELPQAIGNQVVTTVLPDPGLVLDKQSSVSVIPANQDFSWTINYYNDSRATDSEVVITDTLPYGVQLTGLQHAWNANTSGPGAANGSIMTHPAVTISQDGNGQTIIRVVIADNDGAPNDGLREADLDFLEGGTITVNAKGIVGLNSGTILENTAQGCYQNSNNLNNPYCLEDTAEVQIKNPDLVIRKLVNNLKPLPGETVLYSLIVANRGAYQAPNVQINDQLGAGLCFNSVASIVPPTWTLSSPVISGAGCPNNPGDPASCDCSSVAETTTGVTSIAWNNLSNPSFPSGTLPAQSSDVIINYSVTVGVAVTPNTKLNNEATISTSLPEDPDYPNDDPQEIETPLPDPYVIKNAQISAEIGEVFEYRIAYGNYSRQDATQVYLVDALPDVKLQSVSQLNGEGVFCNSVNIPFDPNSPISNGWSQVCDQTSVVIAVIPYFGQPNQGILSGGEGPHTITLTVAAEPRAGGSHLAGTTFSNVVTIFSEGIACNDQADANESDDTEETCLNNTDTAITKTPGYDLFISKSGSVEGSFPGTLPGKEIAYTINFGNIGSNPVCDVKIVEDFPENVEYVSDTFSFLELQDANGNSILPLDSADLAGATISTPVGIEFDGTDTWTIGGEDSSNVCLPPGAMGEFIIYVNIAEDVPDQTVLANSISIDIKDPRDCDTSDPDGPREDLCSNNTSTSQVIVYRTDLEIQKTGISCGEDDDCNTLADNSSSFTNAGDSIRWEITYDNIGNASAENAIITESIPAGTCYLVGSVEQPGNQPLGTALEYSANSGISWSYNPIADPNGVDCAVTNFRLVFDAPLFAPANFWTQTSTADFLLNTLDSQVSTINDEMKLARTSYEIEPASNIVPYLGGVHTSEGYYHVAWKDLAGNEKVLYYSSETDQAINLSSLANDLPSFDAAALPVVGRVRNTLASDGNLFVTWQEDNALSAYSLLLYNKDSGAVTDLTALAAALPGVQFGFGGYDLAHAVATDQAGDVHIAWSQFNLLTSSKNLFYYNGRTNAVVNVSDLATSLGFSQLSYIQKNIHVLSGTDGNIHILWSDDAHSYYFNVAANSIKRFDRPLRLQAVLDGNNYVHAVYSDFDQLMYYSSQTDLERNLTAEADAALTNFSPDSQRGQGYHSKIVINQNNKPLIVWRAYNGESVASDVEDILIFDSESGVFTNLSAEADALSDFNDGGIIYSNNLTVAPNGSIFVNWMETNAIAGTKDLLLYNHQASSIVNIAEIARTTYPAYGLTNTYSQSDKFAHDFDATGNIYVTFRMLAGSGNYVQLVYNSGDNSVTALTDPSLTNAQDGQVCVNLMGQAEVVYSTKDPLSGDDFTYLWSLGENQIDLDLDGSIDRTKTFANLINKNPSCAYEFLDGNVKAYYGTYTEQVAETPNIEPVCDTGLASSWGKVFYNVEQPDNATIKISLLDSLGLVIPGFDNIYNTNGFKDISAIDPSQNIRLKVEFIPSEGAPLDQAVLQGASAIIKDWSVTYGCENSPGFTFITKVKDVSTLETDRILNSVQIDSTTPEITLDNNQDQYELAVVQADLNIDKAVNYSARLDGETLEYTLTTCNQGNNTAKNVLVTDRLPNSLVFMSAPGCTHLAGVVSCQITELAVGACEEYLITGQITGATNFEILNNEACVSSDTYDVNTADNCDNAYTTVATLANVYLSKTGDSEAGIGKNVNYQLVYGNNGNADAENVTVVENIPAETCYVLNSIVLPSDTTIAYSNDHQVSYTYTPVIDANGVDCNITDIQLIYLGSMSSGYQEQIAFSLRVKDDIQLLADQELIDNSASISTSTPEADISDNQDAHQIPIVQQSLSELGGRVFLDRDTDSKFTAGDQGISGVSVYLYGYDIFNNVYGPAFNSPDYNQVITNDFITSLISAGIVPGGTTAGTLATLTNYRVVAADLTSETGDYYFSGLNVGFYNTAEIQPLGYLSTGSDGGQYGALDNDSATSEAGHGLGSVEGAGDVNRIVGIQLGEGVYSGQNNFGEGLGSIGNLVFSDGNSDGVFNNEDQGIFGVEVELYQDLNRNGQLDSSDPLLKVALTNEDGEYLFRDLILDDGNSDYKYLVKVSDSNNILAGSTHTVGAVGVNNNSQQETGYSVTLSLASANNLTADFGYNGKASIGDYVWFDSNQDGIQSANEPGIAGVIVNLLTATGLPTGISTVTDGNGGYLFSDIDPGSYIIEFVSPVTGAYQFTDQGIGESNIFDSDANPLTGRTDVFTVAPGQDVRTVDAGMYIDDLEPASLGDYVWLDSNNDGNQVGEAGVAGVLVQLIYQGNVIAETRTDADGYYQFTGLAPETYTVKFVPASGYQFAIQDSGVAGDLLDSDVNALSGQTNDIILTAGTFDSSIDAGLIAPQVYSLGDQVWLDLNGNGLFDSGTESGVPGVKVVLLNSLGEEISSSFTDGAGKYSFNNLLPGDYEVIFELPDGYTFTLPNIGGDDDLDSDANSISGKTGPINLNSNTENVDAGLRLPSGVNPGSIGDYVWYDQNSDGLQDGSESGVTGVIVRLYNAVGQLISTTETDANGFYQFENLAPADYYVDFVLPDNYSGFTFENQGADRELDSSVNPDTGKSGLISLSSGQNISGIDVGLIRDSFGQIGNKVYDDLDLNGQFDSGSDLPLVGVAVELYSDTNGNGVLDSLDILVRTATTNSKGEYLFDNLPVNDGSGSFRYLVIVSQDTIPQDYVHIPGLPSIDNNSQNYLGYSVVLSSTQPINHTADFGFAEESSTFPACRGVDSDNDGINDNIDIDIDGDGILNTIEGSDDIDLDSKPNFNDLDSDGDGLFDNFEAQSFNLFSSPSGIDSNADGLDDVYGTGIMPIDTDGDDLPDYLDIDADNDGIADNFECQASDANQYIPPSGNDNDCDGLDDSYEPVDLTSSCDFDSSEYPDFREIPQACSDLNLLPNYFTIDGSAHALNEIVGQILRYRLRNSGKVSNQCSPLSRKSFDKQLALSSKLYTEIWSNTWSIPARHYPCTDYLPGNCSLINNSHLISQSRKNARKLRKLVTRHANLCEPSSRTRIYLKESRKFYKNIKTELDNLPNPYVVVCE